MLPTVLNICLTMTTQKGIIVINVGIAELLFSSPMDIKTAIPIEMIVVPKK